MSLKENLENFLENYENMTDLSSSLDGSDSFEMEFSHLKQISQGYRMNKVYPTSCGESEINMRKNRYKDILPFDHSRYVLTMVDNQEGSDYINANYLKGVSSDKCYLAAQGPLPHTVNDFWRMLWESNATLIIMACNEFEQGRHKCERYWVDEGEEHAFGDIVVTQIGQQRVTKDFMIRTLKATKDKEEKVFNQFHYTAWPDHGVPTSVRPILDMIKLVREYQSEQDPPIVVHCSAGCGRTGTICVIDYVRNALIEEKIDQNFSLYDIIVEMRKQRHAIVQTRNQYELVHRAVVRMFQIHLGINPDSKDDFGHNYENVQLRHEHFEQPRMPPKVPGQTGGADKRDSQNRNYVNCNVTTKGVSLDADPPMPKLPSAPSKPHRGVDSPDGTIYANCDVGDSSKPHHDATPHQAASGNKQMPTPKTRQTPDDRYRNNFKATLSAFKDIETDVGTGGAAQAGGTSPSTPPPQAPSQPAAQPRVKPPPQSSKPTAALKPQIAGKPRPTKPNLPVKPNSMDVGVGKAGGEKLGNGETKVGGKMFATRQDSNPVFSPRDASPPSGRSADKKEALKLPKPARVLEKSKSEGGDSSPLPTGGRMTPLKPGGRLSKGDRPSQPPPKPPATAKPSLGKSHAYEEVHISPPHEKSKDTFELPSGKNFRGSPTHLDPGDGKEHSSSVRRKTDSQRKLSSGSIQSVGTTDSKLSRKSSESLEYAYVSTQPQSMVDSLIKNEELQQQQGHHPKAALRSSLSGTDYSYVDSSKIQPPEKPKRGESYSGGRDEDGAYDLVGIRGNDATFDAFADSEGTYSAAGESYDDVDPDAPVVPVRTAQSFQFVEEDDREEKSSAGKRSNLKARLANSRDIIGQQQAKVVNNTKGFLKRIGGAFKPEVGGTHGGMAPDADAAKHSNINELLEKTLKDYQPSYKEGPVVYKEQDIGFPKRVVGPRRPRSPPSSWGVRSAQVHL